MLQMSQMIALMKDDNLLFDRRTFHRQSMEAAEEDPAHLYRSVEDPWSSRKETRGSIHHWVETLPRKEMTRRDPTSGSLTLETRRETKQQGSRVEAAFSAVDSTVFGSSQERRECFVLAI